MKSFQQIVFATISIVVAFACNAERLFAADIIVKANETKQTMIGFGAAIAWYEGTLANHSKKDEIYHYIFEELGLDVLRLRNTYRNGSITGVASFADIVMAMNDYTTEKPKILISSWSPPASLKSNNSTENGGTLKKDGSGKYMYRDFARYWADALVEYSANGIEADYISIQNEPDYTATWESCRFDATENATNAGYGKALDSVYLTLQNEGLTPKLIGPEPIGIGYNSFQNYVNNLNKSRLDGYAYHLYHGESDNVNDNHNPDLFNQNLSSIAKNYTGKPIWVTEYDRGDWLNTVWLINNCIVHGNVSAYLWWQLVWGSGGKPLVEMQSTTYTISKYYWAFRQFSKFVSSDWKRVTTVNDTTGFRISAFVAPDGKKLSVVVINISLQPSTKSFDLQGFTADSGKVIRTSNTESGIVVNANYNGTTPLEFPARSITTIQFFGDVVTSVNEKLTAPSQFSLTQNYPNPFNPSTTIQFSVPVKSNIRLLLVNMLGQVVTTIVEGEYQAGNHQIIFTGKNIPSGVYFYRLETDRGYTQTKKLLLLK